MLCHRQEVDKQSTLLGFVGTPWTLAAYAMEGKADRDCKQTKVKISRDKGPHSVSCRYNSVIAQQ